MKVVILCGGQGTRLREETEVKPKPMVEIGGMPLLWHIMKTYAHYGFKDFVLCLGYKGEVIRRFFYEYELIANDFTVEFGKANITIHPRHLEKGWKVTLVDTGEHVMTGARVKKIEKFIEDDEFMLTYGDGVIDMDIKELLKFHRAHGKIGTVTGVVPQSRYGELLIEDDRVLAFNEKPHDHKNSISGGYFVFNKKIFDYLSDDNQCVLEKDALVKLARDGQLKVFVHKGFWQCMDTHRDYEYLKTLWEEGRPAWKKW
ncbi:MAG TPA: glucose-1-phosphate cytidylyltransferase [Candidatus Omnitrophota bacterium]|nr:glucose-1-phosphate cytidylyltransferase [Candidatus Omnitrophota bacterium]